MTEQGKMKKSGGSAPSKPQDNPKKYTYTVTSEDEFEHDSKEYKKGDEIELDEGTARMLIDTYGVELEGGEEV